MESVKQSALQFSIEVFPGGFMVSAATMDGVHAVAAVSPERCIVQSTTEASVVMHERLVAWLGAIDAKVPRATLIPPLPHVGETGAGEKIADHSPAPAYEHFTTDLSAPHVVAPVHSPAVPRHPPTLPGGHRWPRAHVPQGAAPGAVS